MYRLGCFGTVVLWIFAFAALFFFTTSLFDGIESANTLRNQIFCDRGETYVKEEYRTYGGMNVYSYCVNEAGDEREVSDDYWSLAIVSFLLPFCAGLAFILVPVLIVSVLPERQKQLDKKKGKEKSIAIARERQEQEATNKPASLKERIAELDEALAAGHIDFPQYAVAKQKILERFTNA